MFSKLFDYIYIDLLNRKMSSKLIWFRLQLPFGTCDIICNWIVRESLLEVVRKKWGFASAVNFPLLPPGIGTPVLDCMYVRVYVCNPVRRRYFLSDQRRCNQPRNNYSPVKLVHFAHSSPGHRLLSFTSEQRRSLHPHSHSLPVLSPLIIFNWNCCN